MTKDEMHTQAVEALRVLGTSSDHDAREQYLLSVLVLVYQAGQIDMQAELIEKNGKYALDIEAGHGG